MPYVGLTFLYCQIDAARCVTRYGPRVHFNPHQILARLERLRVPGHRLGECPGAEDGAPLTAQGRRRCARAALRHAVQFAAEGDRSAAIAQLRGGVSLDPRLKMLALAARAILAIAWQRLRLGRQCRPASPGRPASSPLSLEPSQPG